MRLAKISGNQNVTNAMKQKERIYFNGVGHNARKSKNAILQVFQRIVTSGTFLNGAQNNLLVKKLARYFHVPYVVPLASGHDALLLTLSYYVKNKMDEIIIPANSYPTAHPAVLTGVTVKLCDVDINGQINPSKLEKIITDKTKVIVVVHLFGLVGNLKKILEIAQKRNIVIIEDCAQSFGTSYGNQPTGTWGDAGCFSFYPTKNLGTWGDGGAIVTKDKNLYDYLKKMRSYGEAVRYVSEVVSGHSRLPELQAGVLNVYLSSFQNKLTKRKKSYAVYRKILEKKIAGWIRILNSTEESDTLPHLLVIEVENRTQLQKYLAQHGIETHIHYPVPVHMVPAFQSLNYSIGDFPLTERLAKNCLSLPFHRFITEKQMNYISNTIKDFYEKTL